MALLLISLPSFALADTTTADSPSPPSIIDTGHAYVSRKITSIARTIDRFFAKTEVYRDSEGSWATLSLGIRPNSDGTREYVSAVAARLALPNTEKKYNLLVESNVQNPDPMTANDPLAAVTSPVYAGGLRYIVTNTPTWHVHFDWGVEFNVPLDAFASARVNRTFPWTKTQLRIGDTVTKYQSGRENTTGDIVLDHLLSRYWLWRNSLTVKAAYPRSESYALFSSSLFHRIDARHALQLQAIAYGLDDPARLHEYQYNLRYRIRSKDRDWVFYEISPRQLYNENNGFQPVTSIYFGVDLLFRG